MSNSIDKKTLLFSGNTAWGMFNFRGCLLKHFVDAGYNVVVASPYDLVYTPQLQQIGCKTINIVIEAKGANPLAEIRLYRMYCRLIKQVKPDFCFFYTIKPNIYGSMAANRLKVNYVPITTGLGYTFMETNFVAKMAHQLYRYAFRNAPEVWFLNNDDREEFLKSRLIKPEQAYVLKGGEGMDLTRFDGYYDAPRHKTNKVRFLLVARMLYDKGVREFVEAAKILRQKYPEAQFRLLGAMGVANPAAISEEQMEEWLNEGNVKYLGVTSDVVPFLMEADCVVLPSYREGISFTLLEGAAMSLPLVTTNTVGCRDVVTDGVNGFLCQSRDVRSLANAMERVIKMTPAERKVMGQAGRQKIEQEFNVKEVINQYHRLLDRTVL